MHLEAVLVLVFDDTGPLQGITACQRNDAKRYIVSAVQQAYCTQWMPRKVTIYRLPVIEIILPKATIGQLRRFALCSPIHRTGTLKTTPSNKQAKKILHISNVIVTNHF
jgi:hypothetical protein